MTPNEFAAARQALALSIDDLAAELNVPPHSVAAMEQGTIRIPKRIAQDLAWRSAVEERRAALAASGLAECPTAAALERAAAGVEGEAALDRINKLIEHSRGCPECQARSDYLDRHAPPLPDYPMPAWMRGIGWLNRQLDRLPRFMRPPQGDEGEGRRVGVVVASAFSLLAIGIAVFAVFARVTSHRSGTGLGRDLGLIALGIPVAYFVGFFLAGWGFDATRRIRRLFFGYVVRGAVSAAAIYGSVGVVSDIADRDFHLRAWLGFVALFTAIGALGGAILWVIHRVRGKLPGPVA